MAKSSFGKRLFDARNRASTPERRVTQAMVGQVAGVSGVAVGAWEKGQAKPDLEIIPAIAEYFGVSPAFLAFGIADIPHVGTANQHEKPGKPKP